MFVGLLNVGYEERRVRPPKNAAKPKRLPRGLVSWSNHLNAEATKIKIKMEAEARAGDPPTLRLSQDWRMRMEDMVWALVNSPEFVFVP